MTRIEWQQFAERWLIDAKELLEGRRWSAAYYLAGYKACVLARLSASPEIIFEDRKFSERCWTHDAVELVKQAGLDALLASDVVAIAHDETIGSWSRTGAKCHVTRRPRTIWPSDCTRPSQTNRMG